MDFVGENSVLECVEDNEVSVSAPESVGNVSDNTLIHSNGVCNGEHADKISVTDTEPEGVQSIGLPLTEGQSSSKGLTGSGSTPQAKKGFGLKKWKRIPREISREGGNSVDNVKEGKRGLSNSAPNSRKPVLSADTKQKSEGSVSSTAAVVKGSGLVADDIDSGLANGPIFAAAADSVNCEDRSSKSSTAASAPRLRYEIPPMGVYNGIKSSNGDHNSASHRGQRGKSQGGTGKKPRGEQVKIDKENSHSSMESDSRSSNFVFMQGASSVTSKGRQNRRPANFDGENSDEAQGSEQHFVEEHQAGFTKNMAEFEDVSQSYIAADLNWDTKGDNSENDLLSTDQDPFLEYIDTLQSAQDALAQELQKFREMGKDDSFPFGDVVWDGNLPSEFTVDDPNSSGYDETPQSQIVVSLKRNVKELKWKLNETMSMLEVKEAKVTELESALKFNASRQEENREIIESEQRNCKQLETELEVLFKKNIEAEVQYLIISRTIHNLRVAAVDELTFLKEQKTWVSEQAQILNKSEVVVQKASILQRQVDKLETVIESEEVKKLKKRACKFASLFFMQLVMVFVIFCWFVLQLAPSYMEDVPT